MYSCTYGNMPLRIFWTIHRRIYFHKASHTSQTQFTLRIAQVIWYEVLWAPATVKPLWSTQILSSVENWTLNPSSTNSLYYIILYIYIYIYIFIYLLTAAYGICQKLRIQRRMFQWPTPVAARSEARVCGRSFAGITGSNPTWVWMSVCREYCVVR